MPRVRYLFDPICGWCYGAAPAIQMLAGRCAGDFELLPIGLFAAGSRPMTSDWAKTIWHHDQRIAALTGQTFSSAYRERVLAESAGPFDSTSSIRALTLLAFAGESEVAWLERLQRARYVDGLDTSDGTIVARILAEGSGRDAAELTRMLRDDQGLKAAADARVREARLLMRRTGVGGVPAVLLPTPAGERLVDGSMLYGDLRSLHAALADIP